MENCVKTHIHKSLKYLVVSHVPVWGVVNYSYPDSRVYCSIHSCLFLAIDLGTSCRWSMCPACVLPYCHLGHVIYFKPEEALWIFLPAFSFLFCHTDPGVH